MIKALMVITMVSGGEYTAKLPNMEQCMKEIAPVESQRDVKSAACIPRTEDRLPTEVFSHIMDLFFALEEQRQWPCERPNFWKPGEDYYPPNYGEPTS